jgi:hypothetical protein
MRKRYVIAIIQEWILPRSGESNLERKASRLVGYSYLTHLAWLTLYDTNFILTKQNQHRTSRKRPT